VVRGDSHHVDLLDPAGAQPVRERDSCFVGSFEAALGGAVGAFVEDGVDLSARDGGAKWGWNSLPSFPATQWTGKLSLKSGVWEKWPPGSMWWSRVATTY
jgi:hypothetical protein